MHTKHRVEISFAALWQLSFNIKTPTHFLSFYSIQVSFRRSRGRLSVYVLLLNYFSIKSSKVCAFTVCARLRLRCVNYTPVLFRMSYDIKNTVINDVLCYLSTSKKALSCENVILNAVAFYKSEAIRKAKEFIFECCKEKLIVRKSCASHPNPAVADVEDILDLSDKCESKRHLLSEFVAAGFTSMPPSTVFESLAMVLCNLRDEVAALRLEVTEVRQVT